MNKVFLALAFAFVASASLAAEPGAGYGGSTGALRLATHGLATNADEVRTQGGFVTAGAVHWIQVPVVRRESGAVAN